MPFTEQQAHTVLEKLTEISQEVLGNRFISCYALGSLAHGGFSSKVSDIDFCVILKDPIDNSSDADLIDQVNNKIKATNLPMVDRVSIFWSSVKELQSPSGHGRMPALDKLDFLLNAKLLSGKDIRDSEIPQPTQQDLDISSALFIVDVLFGERFRLFIIDPVKNIIKKRNAKWLTKIILFPARLLFTLETGRIGENKLAAEYYADNYQQNIAKWVIKAYQWRTKQPDFSQIKADDLIEAINFLYDQMIVSYAQRISNYGESVLAQKLIMLKNSLHKDPAE